jgi:hypothetical protein
LDHAYFWDRIFSLCYFVKLLIIELTGNCHFWGVGYALLLFHDTSEFQDILINLAPNTISSSAVTTFVSARDVINWVDLDEVAKHY